MATAKVGVPDRARLSQSCNSTPDHTAAPADPDARLLGLEATCRELAAALMAANRDADLKPIADHLFNLEDEIARAAVTGLSGIAVKLRFLASDTGRTCQDLATAAAGTALAAVGRLAEAARPPEPPSAGLAPAPELALLHAEAAVGRLHAEAISFHQGNPDADPDDDTLDRLMHRANALDDFIQSSAATGLAGVCVKLRRLLDGETGMPVGGGEPANYLNLLGILRLLERIGGPGCLPIGPWHRPLLHPGTYTSADTGKAPPEKIARRAAS